MSKPITVSIVGNAGPLRKSLKEADDALGKFGDSMKKIGLAAAAGVGVLAAGIGTAAKAAAEDQKSFALMENAIRNVTGATHEQIKAVDQQIAKMALATGVADDKLRPAYAALVRGTRDVELANRDLSLVLDISTALQMDATTVADALAKGYEGNTKALKSLSPEMAAVIKEGASMSEIMDILSANFSGAASAAADTFEGRMARLQVAFGEIVEQIGYAVLPILERIAGFIADKVVPVIQEFADAFSQDGLSGVLDVVSGKMWDFYDNSSSLTKGVIAGTIALGGMYAAFKTLTFIQTVTTLVNSLTTAINASTVSMGAFQTTALGMAKIVGIAFAAVAISIDQLLADQGFAAKGLLRSVGEFANLIIETVVGALNVFIRAYNDVLSGLNKIPGLNFDLISLIPVPRIPLPEAGASRTNLAPPRLSVPTIEPINQRTAPALPVIPEATIPTVTGGSTGGSSGGSRISSTATETPTIFGPTDYTGVIRSDDPRLLDYLPGELDLINGQRIMPDVVNITVNTVSADANLPNLIVDALQQYNLISGPINVAIAD